jgi:outer membrane protein OmpA-like peptidoglycan-associated protein
MCSATAPGVFAQTFARISRFILFTAPALLAIAAISSIAATQHVIGRVPILPGLNGEWRSEPSANGAGGQIDRIMIQQIGGTIVATQISEGTAVDAGDSLFRGNYTGDSFSIQEKCRDQTQQSLEISTETLTVLDATHIKITGGCSGDFTWERFGPTTLAIDAADLFEFNSAKLKPDARPLLQKLLEMFSQQLVDAKMMVGGYTDNLGTAEHNLQLSTQRARALASWLDLHRMSVFHIRAQGFGEKNPRYPNTTEKGRTHNRRIEIEIQPRVL